MLWFTDWSVVAIRASFPLLLGLGMIIARVPVLLDAPYSVVMITDTLNGALAVTVLVLVLRAAHRVVPARSPRIID
ncbi:hypothetical protein [Streptomyces sp. NPDC051016]|uniref:hypothetical protein n=1 Tax=Streptomyces sp. NPDC051016 TaxID=3365638 RepID=UPI0037B91CD9